MYEAHFAEIVKAINEQVQKKWPPLATGENAIFAWTAKNQSALYAQMIALDAEINALWGGDFEAFKAKVLAWGRIVLQIYKKFAENVKLHE